MFEIEENPGGTYDVRRDRRPVAHDEPSLDDAIEVVRRAGGTEFMLIEADGYATRRPVGR